MFIEEKGKELLDKNLYRNFVVHVCNLFEFGVLGPAHVFSSITRMQEFIRDDGHHFASWPNQRLHWQTQVVKIAEAELYPVASVNSKFNNSSSRKTDFSGIFPKDKSLTPYVVLEPVDNLINKAQEEAKRELVQLQKQEPGEEQKDLETKIGEIFCPQEGACEIPVPK